jgi:hypothetical protein
MAFAWVLAVQVGDFLGGVGLGELVQCRRWTGEVGCGVYGKIGMGGREAVDAITVVVMLS